MKARTILADSNRERSTSHSGKLVVKPITPYRGPQNGPTGGQAEAPILSESQVMQALATCQPYLLGLLPKAIKAVDDALDCDDVRLRTSTAIKLLEGVGTFDSRGNARFRETAAAVGQREEEQRLITSGALLDMMLKKADMYDLELPPDLEWLAPELKKLEKKISDRNKKANATGTTQLR
jgi:hypothetical protein